MEAVFSNVVRLGGIRTSSILRPCAVWMMFTVFSPFCTAQCAKDVGQGKLSRAALPLATMPKTRAPIAFLFLYGLQVADSGLTHSISETETQCNKE